MKVLVTGGKGQLGSELQRCIGENSQWIFTDSHNVDIVSGAGLENFTDIDFLINCAAYTAVDKAESEPQKCEEVNALAPQKLAEYCDKIGATLIHISTDFVFDGKKQSPYLETDNINPLSVYGETKARGEHAVLYSGNHLVVRTAWLYSPLGANFVKTMIRLGRERSELNVVSDQIGTPTYAKDLAMFLIDLVSQSKSKSGIYHFSNEGVASWYDFATEILKMKQINISVKPISSDAYPTPAQRPHFSLLSKEKAKNLMGNKHYFRPWKEALLECINEFE